jgi:hypothetical protein
MSKYSQDFIDKIHLFKSSGNSLEEVCNEFKITDSQARYVIYKKLPTYTKRAQLAKELEPGLNTIFGTELYDETDKAVKEVDTILKRIKRLLFGN